MKKKLLSINKIENSNKFDLNLNSNKLQIIRNKDNVLLWKFKLKNLDILKELFSNDSFWLTQLSNSINNLEKGLDRGWFLILELEGLGYKITKEFNNNNNYIKLDLGCSHGISIKIPEDIDVIVNKKEIIMKSYNKVLVGNFARKLYMLRMNKKPRNSGFKIIKLNK